MSDPKNHDDEPEDITSSGEPDDAESDLDATDADATDEASETSDDVDDTTADDVADDADDDDDARKEKPVAAGKASRSGNPARAAEADEKPQPKRPVKPKKIGNRWAAPAMLTCAGIGLLWIVLYYVFANRDNPIPVMSDLGDWNLIIGMGFIVAAFGFSMKWE